MPDGRKVAYWIEVGLQDDKLRKQMSEWNWEEIMGLKDFGKHFEKSANEARTAIENSLEGADIQWEKALKSKEFQKTLYNMVKNSNPKLKIFDKLGDEEQKALEKTVEFVTAINETMNEMGVSMDIKGWARSFTPFMNAIQQVEDKIIKLAEAPDKLANAIDKLLNKSNKTFTTIANAMASIGVDKSQISSMKQAREEIEKLANSSKVKIDIEYGSLSTDDLLDKLRTKHNKPKANLNDLLEFEWSTLLEDLPDITNPKAIKKQLASVVELEKVITRITGQKPLDEDIFELTDGYYRTMKEIKSDLNEMLQETKRASRETIDELEKGVKKVQESISTQLGKLSEVKVGLTLDEENKNKFKSSINDFINKLNTSEKKDIQHVEIGLDLNKPEKTTNAGRPRTASKDKIEATTKAIQKALDEAQQKYDEISDILNNPEKGLYKNVNPDKPNAALNKSISNAEKQLNEVEKKIINYKYLLSNMDDNDFAQYIASDWKRFSSTQAMIIRSQNDLLDRTKRWRNEINNLLRFKYQWKIEGTEDEYSDLQSAILKLTEDNPLPLKPDIDYLVKEIEEGLKNREISVKLAADGPVQVDGIVNNLSASAVNFVPQGNNSAPIIIKAPVEEAKTPREEKQTDVAPKVAKDTGTAVNKVIEDEITTAEEKIEGSVGEIVGFVERQAEANKTLNATYKELLKDAGVTSDKVAEYLKNRQVPEAVAKKYGTADTFLKKLGDTHDQVNLNNKSPFFAVAKDIMNLGNVIRKNPKDEAKVQEASDKIKSLLIKSIVDSFKNYFTSTKKQKDSHIQTINEQQQIKNAAMEKYNSKEEKQNRKNVLEAKQKEIDELASNTAIAEYENLLKAKDDARLAGDSARLTALSEQERKIIPAVIEGYQKLAKLREDLEKSSLYQIDKTEQELVQLEAKADKTEQEIQRVATLKGRLIELQRNDTTDKNLVAANDAQKIINERTTRVQNIDARRHAYRQLFPIDAIEELINNQKYDGDPEKNAEELTKLITEEILSKSDIADRMGQHKKIGNLKVFDTAVQQLVTSTVDLVQKALSIVQKSSDEMNRRALNESLIGDLKDVAERRTIAGEIGHWGSGLRSENELSHIKDLFGNDMQLAKQAKELGIETDRDKVYLRFSEALDETIDSANELRSVYDKLTEQEKEELRNTGDKEAWFKQKYTDSTEASKNYQLYARYQDALNTLKSSIERPKDENGNSYGTSIVGDLADQLKGYVFRVVIVDENGTKRTVDVGTQRYVDDGKLNKADESHRAGSNAASEFIKNLNVSEAEDIKVYKVPDGRGGLDQPENVETLAVPKQAKTDKSEKRFSARQRLEAATRERPEGNGIVIDDNELEDAEKALEQHSNKMEEIKQRIAAITGGVDTDEYIKSLQPKVEEPAKESEKWSAKYVAPLTNSIIEETNKIVDEEASNIAHAALVDSNPIEALKIPDTIKRMMSIVSEKSALKNKPQNEATKEQLKKLEGEEKALKSSWANSPEADQLLFADIRQLDSLTDQLRKNPENAEVKTKIEQLQAKITQRIQLYEQLLGSLPEEVRQLDGIIKQRTKAENTLPKSAEEAATQRQLIDNLTNQEKNIVQSVHSWKDNIKQQGQSAIDAAYKKQAEQGAPLLAEEYQKQISDLVTQAISLGQQLDADPNNKAFETQLKDVISAISQLTNYYQELLKNNKVVTNGFLGNNVLRQAEVAQKILDNPTDRSLWSEFDEVPDAVKNRRSIHKKSEGLWQSKRTATDDNQKKQIDELLRNLAEQDRVAKEQVEAWVQSVRDSAGTDIFAGLEDRDGHLKEVSQLRKKLLGKKQETKSANNQQAIDPRIETLNNLKEQATLQQAIIANDEERLSLAKRRAEIEEELKKSDITAERKTELQAEYDANKERALKLGARGKKYADTSTTPEELQEIYTEVINELIDRQKESDGKIEKLRKEIAKQERNLGALKADRDPEVVKAGYRRTQDKVINKNIESRIAAVVDDNSKQYEEAVKDISTNTMDFKKARELYNKFLEEGKENLPITDFADVLDPAAKQLEKAQEYAEKRLREAISILVDPTQEQEIINKAITTQEAAINEMRIVDRSAQSEEADIVKGTQILLQEEIDRNNQIVAERKQLEEQRRAVETEIAARKATEEAIKKEAEVVQQSTQQVAATQKTRTATVSEPTSTAYYYGGGTPVTGGVYNLSTEGLALDDTLWKIYELLSGDDSGRTGLGDAERKALEAEREAIRKQLNPGMARNDADEPSTNESRTVASEAEAVKKPLMSIGKAINTINEALKKTTATKTAGMAKAYAKNILENKEAAEAAEVLLNTSNNNIKTNSGLDTKRKLADFKKAWETKQAEELAKITAATEKETTKAKTEKPKKESKKASKEVVYKDVEFASGAKVARATESELKEYIELFGEPIAKTVEESKKQLKHKEAETKESKKQLENKKAETAVAEQQKDNTEELKAREAQISAKLAEDDRLKASRSVDAETSSGGIIGAINDLAKDNTLQQVLAAINEIAKKNRATGSGKGNSAQDLLVRLQNMLATSVNQSKERVAYIDLATGAMTDSVEGKNGTVDMATFEALRNAWKDSVNFNAQVHTHGDANDPYFSNTDLKQFAEDAAKGITTQVLASKNGITVLDLAGVQDLNGLINTLSQTEHNFEALSEAARNFGAIYAYNTFDEITPQGLAKMLGIKGVEAKYTEKETRDNAVKGVIEEEAKEAAKIIQESTGKAIKTTRERYGPEWLVSTEKTDAKGNKTWSKQYDDSYIKAASATKKAFEALGLDKEFGVGTEASIALENYTNKYNKLIELMAEFKKDPNKEGLQEEFNKLLPQLDEAETKLNKLVETKDKFLGSKDRIELFDANQVSNASDSLKDVARARYGAGGIKPGENIAFNGISDTAFGTRLLVDVLKDGTIKQYALEVDKATGQVKEFMVSETALANAFQNVNKAMRQNETVMAKVAIGDNPTQQEAFMNNANSPEWNAYKKALTDMQKYVSNIWNRMAQGGRTASQKELDYIMSLSENVIELGKNVQDTSSEFKTFWEQHPNDVTALNVKIKKRGKNVPSRDEQVRAEMEKLAQTKASASGQRYSFASFDNDTLKYKLTDLAGNVRNVTMVWSELYGQVATVSDKSISSVDTLTGRLNNVKTKLEEALSVGYLNDSNKGLKAFKKQLEDIDNAVKNGGTFEQIDKMRQAAIALGERLTRVANQTKSMMVGTGAKKSADNQFSKIAGTIQGLPEEFKPDLGAKDNTPIVQNYINAYKQLNKDYEKYVNNNKINNPKIQQQLKEQSAYVQLLGKKFLSSANQASKLSELVEQSGFYTDGKTGTERALGGTTSVTAQELSNLEAKMRDYVQNGLMQANIESTKFDSANQKMTYTFRTSKNTVADMVVQYNKATQALYVYQKQERESLTGLAGFLQSMKVKTRSILQYVASMTSIQRVWTMLRQGVQYVKEIDLALTELRKVTDKTEEEYDQFLQTAAQVGERLGATISAVTEATATFAKLGYTMQQATEMAESAIVYKNVGDNIASTEDAADSIISTMKGFRLEATESMAIVDKFNEVGNRFAITSRGIGEALRLSASALSEGGNSLDEAIGLITAANEVVNDPSSVGTALKTLTLRLRGSKTELEEMGEDVSDMAMTTSQLQAKLLALTGGKVDIMLDENTFKNSTQILREMANAWEDMTDIQRAEWCPYVQKCA